MGKGIYGENQGNETRAAGRHAGQVIMAEQLADNELVEGDVVTLWKGYWQTGNWPALERSIEATTQEWLDSAPVDYEGGASKWRSDVLRRIASIKTRATAGRMPKRVTDATPRTVNVITLFGQAIEVKGDFNGLARQVEG